MVKKRMVMGLCLLSMHLIIGVSILSAFDEKQLQTLKKTNKCQGCDLSSAKLVGLDLSYVDLSSANLSGADLSNSVLMNGNLSKANLTGANLSGVNFFEANLSGADLSKANLSKTYLDQAIWTNGKRCSVGSTGGCK